MTIENLKQIAIKYATKKGSRVPLAPDELCNAVVQYMNSFFGVMTDINTIKVAVTEDSGNIVFAITGNTYDGKPITPIVITVDHNDFVTDQEFEEFKTTTNAAIQKNTESINSLSFRVEDTENDITTIQVQVGQINTRVGNTETDVTNLKNRVDNTETNIAESINSLSFRVEDTENDITTIQVQVGQINTRVGNTETDVTNLKNRVDNTETNIAESINSLSFRVEDTENDITTIQVQVGQINTRVGNTETDVTNLKNRVDNTETNIAEINSTLENKVDVIKNPVSNFVAYVHINQKDENVSFTESAIGNTLVYRRASDGGFNVSKGTSGQNAANMENIADVEAKIPDVSGFATKSEVSEKLDKTGGTINGNLTVAGVINTSLYKSRGAEVIDLDVSNTRVVVGNANYNINILSSNRPTVTIGESISNIALENDIPEYTSVDSVIYDATNGAIIAYNGAHEIHIPLLAGENVTIDASEDNKKIVISAAGGGGTGDVTASGNNTFTGENTFTNEITFNTMKSEAGYIQFGNFNYETTEGYDYLYIDNTHINIQKFVGNNQYHEININADLMTYAPPDDNVYYEYKYPRKNGTFALTSDIINNPIYFISFYANEPSEPCHLIGTMMSKNSYGTGQKTNEEFAVMLADNLYTNSNEGLAAYGKLAEKDILCIYSEDGLSIRCLNEANSEVDLPVVMFFVMETEL